MRDFAANDRVIGSELRSALVDAPERATYVETDTAPTSPTDLEVGCDAGSVVVDGTTVTVSAQTESVSDISGQVTETAYRYHTLSVDATGALVVRSSPVGEFDADADAEPITQVTEPAHETGEVFIGTAFQVDAAIERVFDGRYVIGTLPNDIITQGQGSGLDADTMRGLSFDDFASESGTVSTASTNLNTTDVTFANTYRPESCHVSASYNNSTDSAASGGKGGIASRNTDGEGNVTGITIRHRSGFSGDDYETYWEVTGIVIS